MKTSAVVNAEKGEHLFSAGGYAKSAISMNVNVGIPKKVEKDLVSSSSEKV